MGYDARVFTSRPAVGAATAVLQEVAGHSTFFTERLIGVPDSIDGLALGRATLRDVDALVRISTGPIAGKRTFISASIGSRCVVTAALGELIVGYVIWDRAFFGRPFIWLLGVEPAFRRRGIAGRLLRCFESACAGEPLFVSTNESNHSMQALLTGAGFVASGRVENLDPGDPELFFFKPPTLSGHDMNSSDWHRLG